MGTEALMDPVPCTTAPATWTGGTLLNLLVQALSWLAFGFCFGVGFVLAQMAVHKVAG
jgi:hypothetical protein